MCSGACAENERRCVVDGGESEPAEHQDADAPGDPARGAVRTVVVSCECSRHVDGAPLCRRDRGGPLGSAGTALIEELREEEKVADKGALCGMRQEAMSMRSPQGSRFRSDGGAVQSRPIDPARAEGGLGLGVAGTFHVSEIEAHGWLYPLLVEPLEARAEVGAAPALERVLAGEVVGRVLGGILQCGVDLEHDDSFGADLVNDLAQLRPELGQGLSRTAPLIRGGTFSIDTNGTFSADIDSDWRAPAVVASGGAFVASQATKWSASGAGVMR